MWLRARAVTRSPCMSLSRSYNCTPVVFIVLSDLTRVQVLLVDFYSGAPTWEGSESSLDESCFLAPKKVSIMLCLMGSRAAAKINYYRRILLAPITNAFKLIAFPQ
jgi:hypothetical protein